MILYVLISICHLANADGYQVKYGLEDGGLNVRTQPSSVNNEPLFAIDEGTLLGSGGGFSKKWMKIPVVDRSGKTTQQWTNVGSKYANKYSDLSSKLVVPDRDLNNMSITIFKDSGKVYPCTEEKCPRAGWPTGENPMKVIKTEFHEIPDENGAPGSYRYEAFYKVEYKKLDGNVVHGWVSASEVTTQPNYQKRMAVESKKACHNCNKKQKSIFKEIVASTEVSADADIDRIFDKIKDKVGICAMKKGGKKGSRLYPSVPKGKSPWDHVIAPRWKKSGAVPDVDVNVSGKKRKLSKYELIDIDTCSRSTFAEMHICDKYGPQFSLAVIATTTNRVLAQRSKRYGNGVKKRFSRKPSAAAPKELLFTNTFTKFNPKSNYGQYNAWDKYANPRKKTENSSLRMALCPSKSVKQRAHNGHPVTNRKAKHWERTVKACIEAVTNPQGFRDQTKGDMGVNSYYYTSKVNWKSVLGCYKKNDQKIPKNASEKQKKKFERQKKTFERRKKACARVNEIGGPRKIRGNTLNKSKCIRLWHDDSLPSMNVLGE